MALQSKSRLRAPLPSFASTFAAFAARAAALAPHSFTGGRTHRLAPCLCQIRNSLSEHLENIRAARVVGHQLAARKLLARHVDGHLPDARRIARQQSRLLKADNARDAPDHRRVRGFYVLARVSGRFANPTDAFLRVSRFRKSKTRLKITRVDLRVARVAFSLFRRLIKVPRRRAGAWTAPPTMPLVSRV